MLVQANFSGYFYFPLITTHLPVQLGRLPLLPEKSQMLLIKGNQV